MNRELSDKMMLTTIMTVYIGSKADEVDAAISSILAQTALPDQFIIFCDGPVAAEVDDVLAAASKHPVIEIHKSRENLGRGQARNHAIAKAAHDLIAVMDSDDIARPDRFEKQLRHFAASDTDILGGVIEEFRVTPGDLKWQRICHLKHRDILARLPFRTPVNNVTTMFRRGIFDQVGGYRDLNFVEDWDFFARAAHAGARFSNLPDVLVDVRINPTRNYNMKYLVEEIANIRNIGRLLRVNFLVVAVSVCLRIIRALVPEKLIDAVYSVFLHGKPRR